MDAVDAVDAAEGHTAVHKSMLKVCAGQGLPKAAHGAAWAESSPAMGTAVSDGLCSHRAAAAGLP
jgi:hypothetical protein